MFRLARLILFVGIGFYLGYKYKEMQISAYEAAPRDVASLTIQSAQT